MPALHIRDIDNTLYWKIKTRAFESNQTLRDWILSTLSHAIEEFGKEKGNSNPAILDVSAKPSKQEESKDLDSEPRRGQGRALADEVALASPMVADPTPETRGPEVGVKGVARAAFSEADDFPFGEDAEPVDQSLTEEETFRSARSRKQSSPLKTSDMLRAMREHPRK